MWLSRYYCFLIPMTLPILFVAVYFHWLSMKLFKHAWSYNSHSNNSVRPAAAFVHIINHHHEMWWRRVSLWMSSSHGTRNTQSLKLALAVCVYTTVGITIHTWAASITEMLQSLLGTFSYLILCFLFWNLHWYGNNSLNISYNKMEHQSLLFISTMILIF